MNSHRHYRVLVFCLSFIGSLLFAGPLLPQMQGVALDLPAHSVMAQTESSTSSDILPSQFHLFEGDSVYLDGTKVFSVGQSDGSSARERANVISQRFQKIAQQLRTSTPQVSWQVEPDSQLPVMSINGTVLMTVTLEDAQHMGFASPKRLANALQRDIERALEVYQQERKPDYLWRQGRLAAAGMAAMLVISLGIYWRQRRLQHKFSLLQDILKRGAEEERSAEEDREPDSDNATQMAQRRVDLQQRYSWLSLQQWIFGISQAVVWGGGILLLMGLFPYTRQWRPDLLQLLGLPIKLALIGLVIYGLIRFGHVLIDRIFLIIQNSASRQSNASKRLALRFSTASRVTKNVIGSVLIAAGFLAGLSLIGIDLGPLLAGAGIIGLALSFASQNVLKDVINGFLILLEDQFGVGDVIVVGDVAGFVENMNLRITQLRNEEGRLITVPNSQIAIVQNLSKEWSRVDLMIPVALHSDIDRALEIIRQVAEEMQNSHQWSALILEPPMILGVDKLNHEGAMVRVWIMTQPLKQWDVAREYRRRLKVAFDQSDVDIGVPRQAMLIHPSPTLKQSVGQHMGGWQH